MTAPITAATAPPPAPTPSNSPRRRRLGWLGWSLLIVLAILLITIAGIALAGSGTNETPLHPDNAGPDGTMAMAEVLAARDVAVRTVENHTALENAEPGPDDTVVISSSLPLDPGVARQLVPTLQRAGRVVIVADDFSRLPDLQLPVAYLGDDNAGQLTASCRGDVVPAEARVSGLFGSFEATDPQWSGCFATDNGHALQFGSYGDSTAVVIASTEFATNQEVLDADNAQTALWLYGSQSRVLWYLPDPSDTVDPGSGADDVQVAPTWFAPVLVLLGFAVVTLMIARGRRFGPLSREPMPVVVSALETTRIRGRLYRGTDDLAHSAQLLRSAAVGRLARRVGLPPNADAELVAHRLSSTHPSAADLLTGPLPTTADDAVRWLQALRRLEEEVADD